MSAVSTLLNAKQFTEPEPSDVQKLCIIGAWSCSLCGWRQRRVLGCLIWSLPRLKTRSTTFSVANNCAMTRCHALINITISHLNDRTLIHYNTTSFTLGEHYPLELPTALLYEATHKFLSKPRKNSMPPGGEFRLQNLSLLNLRILCL